MRVKNACLCRVLSREIEETNFSTTQMSKQNKELLPSFEYCVLTIIENVKGEVKSFRLKNDVVAWARAIARTHLTVKINRDFCFRTDGTICCRPIMS